MSKFMDSAEIVEMSGPEAETFAQSQFSNDVSALPVGSWHWNAWLDPQGRVRFLFALLHLQSGQLLAWLPMGNANDMASGLSRFIFRSRLTITALPEACLLETPMVDKPEQALAYGDDNWSINLPGLPLRQVTISLGRPDSTQDTARLLEWRSADIAAGLPWIAAELSGEFTPPALGLERLSAVSLSKGCYPGQEIVARLHYRGGNKRHCVRLAIEGDHLPPDGEWIHEDLSDAAAGRILYAAQSPNAGIQALAILPAGLTDGTGLRLASGARITNMEKA
ncbi:YgfZ/GcvT domain-containing protein [Dokdonella sp.]|uniref:CAF17-like 4Fe-4S cluster assembly/insertion protein YgfZ n=1 Tax=Dokdonella sp. TaxID=2291710 RepID=UPI003C3FBAA2